MSSSSSSSSDAIIDNGLPLLTFFINFAISGEKELEAVVKLISKGYKLALGFLILGIVFIIIHNIIKHYTNKEVVPL